MFPTRCPQSQKRLSRIFLHTLEKDTLLLDHMGHHRVTSLKIFTRHLGDFTNVYLQFIHLILIQAPLDFPYLI